MTTGLYEATVERFAQGLSGVAGFLDRGLAHCLEVGIDPQEIAETRLWSDMLPFSFQIVSVAHHSLGAIEGVKAGVFSPPHQEARSYDELQAMVAAAREALQGLGRDEINGLEGREMVFKMGERTIPFLAEGFLLSFSLPNFYFHATTAYDILRSKGVPLGKRDFTGPLRTRR
jgi:uncharacterized protein